MRLPQKPQAACAGAAQTSPAVASGSSAPDPSAVSTNASSPSAPDASATPPRDARFAGVFRYAGARAPEPATPRTGAGLAAELTALAALAGRYLEAGKARIAADVLCEADAALAAARRAIEGDAQGLHPGLWRGGARSDDAATRALAEAEAALVDARARLAAGVGAARAIAKVGDGQHPKRTVMLFGSSANPPTGMGGHMGIVAWGARDARVDLADDAHPERAREAVPMDEVWVLPVYKHAFASKSNLAPFEHRAAMAKLAFESIPGLEGRVHVADAEKRVIERAFAEAARRGEPPESVRVGTIDVVRTLMGEHPDTQFVLALGADTFADLTAGKWKEGDTLRQLLPILVVPREGVAGTEDNAPQLTDISSTKVRGSTDLGFLQQALHPDVLAYIQTHKLYAFTDNANVPAST
jgi:nicotinic acid mononucleotide adenylyltransferase